MRINEVGAEAAEPGAGNANSDAGLEPETEDGIGDAVVKPGAGDATDDASVSTKSGMGATIGDADEEPVQVCEPSKFTVARGASFAAARASTVGPLSLILPGASLPRLARRQIHLVHRDTMNSRVFKFFDDEDAVSRILMHSYSANSQSRSLTLSDSPRPDPKYSKYSVVHRKE